MAETGLTNILSDAFGIELTLKRHYGDILRNASFFYNLTMAYRVYNPNPINQHVGDCVIRAISKITGCSWDDVYLNLAIQGFAMKDMPSANHVWGAYLNSLRFVREVIPNTCPDCYSIKEFCIDNPIGEYIVATGEHVVAVIDGNYYDSWDSGNEIPIYYWHKSKGVFYHKEEGKEKK